MEALYIMLNIFIFFLKRGRNAYIRDCGMSYANVEKWGNNCFPLRDASCRYPLPARYDDLVHVRTGISETGGTSLVFVYEIWNEDKEPAALRRADKACPNWNSSRPPGAHAGMVQNLCLYGIVPEQ